MPSVQSTVSSAQGTWQRMSNLTQNILLTKSKIIPPPNTKARCTLPMTGQATLATEPGNQEESPTSTSL